MYNKGFRLEIDRKDNNKGYEKGNLALCCCRCNTIKSDFFTEEEMFKVGAIIEEAMTRLIVKGGE